VEGVREGGAVREATSEGVPHAEGEAVVGSDGEGVAVIEGTREAVTALEGEDVIRAERELVAEIRGDPVLETLETGEPVAMEALARPEVEGGTEAEGEGLLEGDAVSDARMGMLTMQECTPTAR